VSSNTLFSVRAGLGFAGGLTRFAACRGAAELCQPQSQPDASDRNAAVVELGASIGWYQALAQRSATKSRVSEASCTMSFLKDRLRLAVGSRDIKDAENHGFFRSV